MRRVPCSESSSGAGGHRRSDAPGGAPPRAARRRSDERPGRLPAARRLLAATRTHPRAVDRRRHHRAHRSHPRAGCGRDRGERHHRPSDRVLDDPDRPSGPSRPRDRDRAAARDPHVRGGVRARVRARAGRADRDLVRLAATVTVRFHRCCGRTHPVLVPLCAPDPSRGTAWPRPVPRGGVAHARSRSAGDLPARHAAAAPSGHRCRGPARRAVRAERLRCGLDAAHEDLHLCDLPAVPHGVRPFTSGAARPRARRDDRAHPHRRGPARAGPWWRVCAQRSDTRGAGRRARTLAVASGDRLLGRRAARARAPARGHRVVARAGTRRGTDVRPGDRCSASDPRRGRTRCDRGGARCVADRAVVRTGPLAPRSCHRARVVHRVRAARGRRRVLARLRRYPCGPCALPDTRDARPRLRGALPPAGHRCDPCVRAAGRGRCRCGGTDPRCEPARGGASRPAATVSPWCARGRCAGLPHRRQGAAGDAPARADRLRHARDPRLVGDR